MRDPLTPEPLGKLLRDMIRYPIPFRITLALLHLQRAEAGTAGVGSQVVPDDEFWSVI